MHANTQQNGEKQNGDVSNRCCSILFWFRSALLLFLFRFASFGFVLFCSVVLVLCSVLLVLCSVVLVL
jgi:hypothetical protein